MGINFKAACEIRCEGRWVSIGLAEAARLRNGMPLQCAACHGAVLIRSKFFFGNPPYVERVQIHAGCANRQGCFQSATRHPEALD